MGHNSVVLDHTKSTGIPRVNGLSMGSPDYVCVCVCVCVFETELCR